MAQGKLRYNEDYSLFEAILPNGSEFDPEEVPDSGIQVIEDPDDPTQNYLAVLVNYDGDDSNLEANTLYQLTPISTDIEDNCEFEEVEDEEGEEEDEAEAPAV
jgi:hypothetical protein